MREQDAADISNLTELAELFPDFDPNLPGNRELTPRTIVSRPQPHHVTTIDDDSDQNDDDAGYGDGTDEIGGENEGGGGNGGSGGSGSGGGGSSGAGGSGGSGKKAAALPHIIQELVIMRAGPKQLNVALSPSVKSRCRLSFSLEPSGEMQWREGRLPITAISRVYPAAAKAELANDIVTVAFPQGHTGPVMLTLDIATDAAYTGYAFSERQEPAAADSNPQRIEQIRQLLAENRTQTEIARELGISRQRVSQLVAKHKLKGGRQP